MTSGTKTIFTNFYPRSPCGERRCLIMLGGFAVDFYPRSPCGERLGTLRTVSVKKTFLSTLSLRRATMLLQEVMIMSTYFYPRSPCGERPPSVLRHCTTYLFLSTLSLRRATDLEPSSTRRLTFLSTLSLRRATNADCNYRNEHRYFYPRSPCGERLNRDIAHRKRQKFLSTLSLRRATA